MASGASVSLSDKAYDAIRDEILRGQLRPGTPLSRRRLARQLGMSVLPVTDALRRLEGDGLVESRARAGTRVRVPSEKDVRELYELREALETQSARLFAERATPANRLELVRLGKQVDALFDRMAEDGSDPAFRFSVHSRHVELHMRIAEHAGSALLQRMIAPVESAAKTNIRNDPACTAPALASTMSVRSAPAMVTARLVNPPPMPVSAMTARTTAQIIK